MTNPRGDSPQADPGDPSVTGLLALRVLDGPLAALAWLLAEARVPVIVVSAAADHDQRVAVREALTDLAAPGLRRVRIDAQGRGLEGLTAADTAATLLVGPDLAAAPAPALQVPFKALSRGAGLVASMEASTLEDVYARLRRLDIRLSDDELTFIGLVLVVRRVAVAGPPGSPGPPGPPGSPVTRVVAAHYVRPLARDPGGHVQRMGPAVLATWDEATDTFEDYSWGIAAELAGRIGIRPGDLDHEVERRAAYLAGLVAGGVRSVPEVRTALDGFRLGQPSARASGAPGTH